MLAAVATAIFTYDSISFRRRMVDDTTVLAKMLEIPCAQAVVFSDPASAEEALSTLQAQAQVVAAAVYAQDGTVFASYTREKGRKREPPKTETRGHRFRNDHLELFHSMVFGQKEVGSVFLLLDMTALTNRQRDYAKILTIDMLAAFLLAFVLSSRLQRLISKPILHLLDVERTVSEKKDYSIRAVKETQDEVGLLIDGFNEMLVEVEKRDAFLREKGEQLREKNEQILDSIHYAQRIQESILPLPQVLEAAFPEHFVIFRPCHIVSGDFYWCYRGHGKVFLAVVDCTGHGVPGAFMSMIGGSLLRGIVVERGVTDPATILEHLSSAVRETLHQSAESLGAQDGMDVCLCVFDDASGVVTFSGAKRPLYVVRQGEGGGELSEVAGDRTSIGGRQRESSKPFTRQALELGPGDMLYLTTDGYVDQNGSSGKRFGSDRLRALLRAIAGRDPADQRRVLLSQLETHQGEAKQRDDITIIGIRVQRGAESA